jgi:hypothetical protein
MLRVRRSSFEIFATGTSLPEDRARALAADMRIANGAIWAAYGSPRGGGDRLPTCCPPAVAARRTVVFSMCSVLIQTSALSTARWLVKRLVTTRVMLGDLTATQGFGLRIQ